MSGLTRMSLDSRTRGHHSSHRWRGTAYGTLTSVAPRKKPVHLFADQILIADRWTQREIPAAYYAVEGDLYDVTSYVEILEQDGSDGFNVQVVVRPRATGSRRDGHHV